MIVKNAETKENKSAAFQVEASSQEFEAAVNAAYLKNKGQINIPGFRKGKAPRQVIEGMYGVGVFYQDAIDELAPKAFEAGMTETGYRMVGSPRITDYDVTEEKTVVFSFEVDLYPEVTLGQYKGIEVSRKVKEVTDEDVDAEIDSVRKRNARKVSVERAAEMGDTANIDFDGYLDGERFDGGKAEGYSLELGSNSFVPGFEDQIVGMNIGEEKDIDITFPEDYVENLAGKAVVFKVKLNSLTVSEMDELDDEFARDVSEFDTLEEYKASVRAEIEKRNADGADEEAKSEVMRMAVENLTVDVPEVMITEKVEEILRSYASNFGMNTKDVPFDKLCSMMGVDEETISTSIRPAAEFQVKQDLLVEAVVNAENFEVTEEETEKFVQKTAESIGATAEEIKSYFGDEFILAEQKKEMALNCIFDSAVFTDTAEEQE